MTYDHDYTIQAHASHEIWQNIGMLCIYLYNYTVE